jgi:site-specific recombinase XerD
MRFSEAVDRYLRTLQAAKPSPHTVAAYRRDLHGLAARIGEPETLGLEQLSKDALRDAFASWADDHAKSSVMRAWSTWNGFFRFLVEEDLVAGNPMAAVRRPKPGRSQVKNIKGDGYVPRLLEAAANPAENERKTWPERDLALMATLLLTGLRLGELISLTVGSFDGGPGSRVVTVVGKGDKAREVPIDDALDSVLQRYLRTRSERFPRHDLQRPDTPLFIHHDGQPMTRDHVQYVIDKIYRRAGVRAQVPKGALVHALRHTFATDALRGGASVLEAQRLLGHASLNTTQRYLEATGDELRQAVNAHPSKAGLELFLKEESASP